jgi:hypothetical protein
VSEMLTPAEHAALDMTRMLAGAVAPILGGGPEMQHDWNEFVQHLHAIQHMIMAQAAARAYPGMYRLLGEAPP